MTGLQFDRYGRPVFPEGTNPQQAMKEVTENNFKELKNRKQLSGHGKELAVHALVNFYLAPIIRKHQKSFYEQIIRDPQKSITLESELEKVMTMQEKKNKQIPGSLPEIRTALSNFTDKIKTYRTLTPDSCAKAWGDSLPQKPPQIRSYRR